MAAPHAQQFVKKTATEHINTAQRNDDRALTFDDLSPVEQAAASLGVQPGSIKPIGWLNDAHFQTLKDNNALHPDLSRRIEAFRYVSKMTSPEA